MRTSGFVDKGVTRCAATHTPLDAANKTLQKQKDFHWWAWNDGDLVKCFENTGLLICEYEPERMSQQTQQSVDSKKRHNKCFS